MFCISMMMISSLLLRALISTRLNLSSEVCWLLSLSSISRIVTFSFRNTVRKPSSTPKFAFWRKRRLMAQSNRMYLSSNLLSIIILLFFRTKQRYGFYFKKQCDRKTFSFPSLFFTLSPSLCCDFQSHRFRRLHRANSQNNEYDADRKEQRRTDYGIACIEESDKCSASCRTYRCAQIGR